MKAGRQAAPNERPAPIASQQSDGLWPQRSQVQLVCQGLCISNFFGAKSLTQLQTAGVTHVLVCAGELPTVFPQHFAYRRLSDLYDGPSQPLQAALQAALPWMAEAIEQGGRVLLHCAGGVSRSAAVAVAYLMWREGRSVDEALHIVRMARPIVSPNDCFLTQLRALDWSQFGPPPPTRVAPPPPQRP